MKIVKCLSNGGYKLTEGDLYGIVAEKDGYYHLINDNDKLVKYNTGFFEDHELEEDVVEEVVEEAAKIRTIEDVINSISVRENDHGQISFLDKNNEKVFIENEFNTDIATECSCGIGDVTGLNDMCHGIDGKTDDNDLRKALFEKCIRQYILIRGDRAAFILSTVIYDIGECYLEVLSNLCNYSSLVLHNPNSGNEIQFWIFYV